MGDVTNTRALAHRRHSARVLALMLALLLPAGCTGGLTGGAEDAASQVPVSVESTSSSEATSAAESDQLGEVVEMTAEPEAVVPQPAGWSEITEKVAVGARFLCVDRKTEYDVEHVKGASSVPLSRLDEVSAGWAKDGIVVLTSSAEEVARSGASHLARAGFTNVYYLEGGYDAWKGTFEGTDARKATVPVRLYYLYTTSGSVTVIGENTSRAELLRVSREIANGMDDLESQFEGDVEVEVVDYRRNQRRAIELVRTYRVPTTRYEGVELVLVPRWILVDRDGRVQHMHADALLPMVDSDATKNWVYGWCVEQTRSK